MSTDRICFSKCRFFTPRVIIIISFLSALMIMLAPVIENAQAFFPSDSSNGAYYLYPPSLHLSLGTPSSIHLAVVDRTGKPVAGVLSFYGYDTSLIAVAADGGVTPLRSEASNEIGTWVRAAVNGSEAANSSVVRVLSQARPEVFNTITTTHTLLYYPASINGADLSADVARHQIPLVNEYGYIIQSSLLGLQPFQGARQVFAVDFGETEQQRVCGISGNPIRLGWNIAGNAWQNCFLVPFIAPRSPQWVVMQHELAHNFTLASQIFQQSLGIFQYTEGVATAASLTSLSMVVNTPAVYPVSSEAASSIQQQISFWSKNVTDSYQAWLGSGANFAALNPDDVDGIWLHYQAQRPADFAVRFFTPLQPKYACILQPLLNTLGVNDQHTAFAALVSAARGQDLSAEFSANYHYPLNNPLFNALLAKYTLIADDPATPCPKYFLYLAQIGR